MTLCQGPVRCLTVPAKHRLAAIRSLPREPATESRGAKGAAERARSPGGGGWLVRSPTGRRSFHIVPERFEKIVRVPAGAEMVLPPRIGREHARARAETLN